VTVNGYRAQLYKEYGEFMHQIILTNQYLVFVEIYFISFKVEPPEVIPPDLTLIVINQPWYYFYETNKYGKIPWRMTKPTPAQIEDALAFAGIQGATETDDSKDEASSDLFGESSNKGLSSSFVTFETLQDFSKFLPGNSYSDHSTWTQDQINEAKLEAVLREGAINKKEKIEIDVDEQLVINNKGRVILKFDPFIKFPIYMIASNNSE